VLINLLTNAIKFTGLEKTRRVCVVLSASTVAPASIPGGVHFNEEKLVEEDQRLVEDWKLDANLVFVQFSVTDTGRGLTEDEHMTLFTRFSQASPRTHISYGGSGLGLFISRRLTELQGGAIGVTSQYKKGSTFSFYIKTRQIKPAMRRRGSMPNALPEDIRHRPTATLGNRRRPSTLLHVSSDNLPTARRSAPPSPRCLRQPLSPHVPPIASANSVYEFMRPSPLDTSPASPTLHVLVVEDNLVNQRVLAKQLRNMGCIVSVANHGREALAFLDRTTYWNREVPASYPTSRRASSHIPCTEPPPESDAEMPLELSLVLMDWEMPVMNGLEAVMQIRQMEREGVLKDRVPIIGVTANVREQQVRAAMEAGMDDVVGKPFRVAELVVRMRGLISRKGGGE
jgi:CheY-like chemotaxis protein